MAESSPSPKTRSARARGRQERPGPWPASRPTWGRPHGGCQHIRGPALALESNLSSDMAIEDEELDAITRLLGEALDKLLASS
jgi:hypothetical protein